eukprot:12480451-Heterocapsa_arctica.AAC.1
MYSTIEVDDEEGDLGRQHEVDKSMEYGMETCCGKDVRKRARQHIEIDEKAKIEAKAKAKATNKRRVIEVELEEVE